MRLIKDPLTRKKVKRFKSIKRGYYSLVILGVLILISLFAELLVNNRAVYISYEGKSYFPTYGGVIEGNVFGMDQDHEVNYRDLKKKFKGTDNFVLMPLISFGPLETDFREGKSPPYPPSLESGHILGTDVSGRDVFARLFYGFRIAIFFSLLLLILSYLIGVTIGCLMGYLGGKFDLYFQRMIEIWSNIPTIYLIIIVASIIPPTFGVLLGVMVFFYWVQMTWYMRTATYKEKAREYVLAARALGAGHSRIIFQHIIPNTVSVIITFMPFTVATGITALTALDYLGFGMPPPTPSWGALLREGTANLESQWIVMSAVVAMCVVLTMVTFIGEAIREAFDPKKFSYYE